MTEEPPAGIISATKAIEMAEALEEIRSMMKEQQPTGEMEPLILTVEHEPPTEIKPAFPWFSVTIVKRDPVELHVTLNPDQKAAKPDTMDADEKVWDGYFSKGVIKSLTLQTNIGEVCRVRVRGLR